MKLYGNPMSTCTRKVLTVLAEKDATAEFVNVELMRGDQKKPAHLARQPFGVVPVIEEDDGFSLYESRAIIRYLDETLPGVSLTPKDAKGRARMEQWMSIEHSYLTPVAMKIVYQKLFGPMRGVEADEAIVEQARAELSKVLDIANKELTQHEFLAGDTFTLADISWLPYIEYLWPSGSGDLVTSRSGFGGWWSRVSQRPSWLKATGK